MAKHPGKPEKLQAEEQVEILPNENQTPQPAAEVELDAATGKPVEAPKSVEPSVSAEEFRKLQARYEYQARQFERSQREMQEQLTTLRSAPQPVIHTEKPGEDDIYGLNREYLNQIGQADWTKPVQLMAEKIAEKKAEERFKALMAEQEKKHQETQKLQTTSQMLEREKQWVLEKEPSLNDESSEQFRGFYATYNRMIQEDPTLLQNPRAPRLVYHEWRSESSKPVTAAPVADPERERLKRVAGGVAPTGRPVSSPKTIKLSQEDVDFCEKHGISPAMFASMKDANYKEGVTA